ncbi:hypothetical protein FRB96_009387 [Tulasnella sp. 330]|nr:hypothetical protein FRB96_009387 [Tulasnella sp. 330]KAG8884705.1 hypothetical protein FRB97_003489 [Tulasnella sp. 331]KAG8889678.1 hypothetical protein FRB98_003241 [Tulasnella sp. 332]
MAPILTTPGHGFISVSRRQNVPGTTASISTSNNTAIYMVGIAVICIAIAALFGWLGLRHWRARQAAAGQKAEAEIVDAYIGEDFFKSEGMTSDSFEKHRVSVVETPTITKPLPPRPARPSLSPLAKTRVRSSSMGSSGRPYSGMSASAPASRSRLRISTLPQDHRSSTATTAENELIDYHLNEGTMPVAFAPLSFIPPDSPNSARDPSVTINQASRVTIPKLSPGPEAHRPQSNDTTSHFRLGSLTASIRHSLTSLAPSPTKSVFNYGVTRKPFRTASTIPPPSPENQRTIVIASFNPLLPDELVLKPDVQEKVTVLETYDDGWCIVARTNLGVLEVGAVPEWVFGLPDGEDEMFAMRPMRSTSLGVTVNVRVVDTGPAEASNKLEGHFSWALATMTDARASVISWSNY